MLNSGTSKKMDEDPEHSDNSDVIVLNGESQNQNKFQPLKFLKGLFTKSKADTSLREAIEEVIENGDEATLPSEFLYERTLITNVLAIRDLTVADVMIQRADIVAIEVDSSLEEIQSVISKAQHSRYPVYHGSIDNIIGTIHIKDLLLAVLNDEFISIEGLSRTIPIVSPSMPVHQLLLQMQETKKHMVLVIDEYGGIDGMATIGDIIEDIVGNIDDEYDLHSALSANINSDGTITADARIPIEDFEEEYGSFLDEEEREELNTLAGVVFSLAGRVPVRGELISHPSGIEFEVLDSDARRINRLKVRNLK